MSEVRPPLQRVEGRRPGEAPPPKKPEVPQKNLTLAARLKGMSDRPRAALQWLSTIKTESLTKVGMKSGKVIEGTFGAEKSMQGAAAKGLAEEKSKGEAVTDSLLRKEEAYFEEYGKKFSEQDRGAKVQELRDRYEHEATSAATVLGQVEQFAEKAGLSHQEVPELKSAYSSEAKGEVSEIVQTHIDTLFNSDKGIRNPEKYTLVSEEAKRYLDLVSQAQAEGDLPRDLSSQDVLELVTDNVWKLAYQDQAARENFLGDHGVRHLVGHNIRVVETLFDEVAKHGQEVHAIDRLKGHQIMIDHDIGYAMDPVRDPIKSGKYGADAGHNVLAAKFVREQGDAGVAVARVYSKEQLASMHEGILHHDSSDINFKIGENTPEARQKNLESAVHLADNTDAFEKKLPEILYSVPETFRYIRLMQAAAESGDSASVGKLRDRLSASVRENTDFTTDDKDTLLNAIGQVDENSFKFTAPRLNGVLPTYAIESDGHAIVTVQESVIHRMATRTFAQETNQQISKLVKDVAGIKGVNADEQEIASNGRVTIKIRTGENKATEKSDYQQRLEEAFSEPTFQDFMNGKNDFPGELLLSQDQKSLELELKVLDPQSENMTQIQARIDRIKAQRKEALAQYMQQV